MSKGIGDYTKYLVGDEGFLIDTSNPGSALLDLGILGLAATGVGAPIAAGLKAGTKARKAKKLIEEAKKARKRRLAEAGTAEAGTSTGEIAGLKGVYGDLSLNKHEAIFSLPEFSSSLQKKPYLETYFGLENIFKFIRLDFIWRLSYIDNTFDGIKVSPFGLRGSLQFDF